MGFEGENCEKTSCIPANCSNNGVCIQGSCACFRNYTGSDCSQFKPALFSFCNNHGDFEYSSKSCKCFDGWSAPDCSKNENCVDLQCTTCKNGWTGVDCLFKVPFTCNPRCSKHGGICVNGTCNCALGFRGRNCEISKSLGFSKLILFSL
jgi:leishmanolysin